MTIRAQVFRAVALIIALVVAAVHAAPAAAQLPLAPAASAEATAAPSLDDLPPGTVDALLSRLTDADVRALLRDELQRREAARAKAVAESARVASLGDRIEAMRDQIQGNVRNIVASISALGQNAERVAALRATAAHGLVGMILAFSAIVGAAAAAAYVTFRLTESWRLWLLRTDGSSYWDRLLRTAALTALELAPIAAFSTVVWAVAPALRAELGPMEREGFSYIWIFEAGVVNVWIADVLFQRVFAPSAPQLRIANASDAAARHMRRLVRAGALLGMGGWLLAGLWPMLGYGFAPAILTVAIAGTLVYGYFVVDIVGGLADMRAAMGQLFGANNAASALWRAVFEAASPWIVVAYFTFGYLYWLAHWLATGQQHLNGPVGTLLVGLALPALDRLGDELAWTLLHDRASDRAQRLHGVLRGAWRVVLGFAATVAIANLWGFDLIASAKGALAPRWASAAFDIALTVLVGQLIWRLIQAALHQERYVAGGDLEEVDAEPGGRSRLQTLIPMFRILLLMILSIIVMMIVLSSLGVSIGPLLASAGIVGIAIGFGAQTLVRDIFSGAFFLIDDAFRVGEYIELEGELRGEVEAISIRSLQLRHHRGSVITIPFGELKSVINHNRDWVIYKMPFRLEPQSDPLLVKKIVKRIGAEMLADPEHGAKFIEPLKSQGVFSIDDDSALIMRVKFKCRPRMQFVLRREVYHRLRVAFDEAGIRFARRKVEVVSSHPPAPGAAASAEAAAAAASVDAAIKPSAAALAGDSL